MNEKSLKGITWLLLLFLIGIGIWMIWSGRGDFGLGLIAGAAGVSITKFIKQKHAKELQAQGLNPYDERAYAIGYRASYVTLRISVILAAFFVLIGSILGPQITVNPYNFTGIGLGIMVLIYVVSYRYYNREM